MRSTRSSPNGWAIEYNKHSLATILLPGILLRQTELLGEHKETKAAWHFPNLHLTN